MMSMRDKIALSLVLLGVLFACMFFKPDDVQ